MISAYINTLLQLFSQDYRLPSHTNYIVCVTLVVEPTVYLFINYNTITNYIPFIYELSNFDHVLGGNRTQASHANSLSLIV